MMIPIQNSISLEDTYMVTNDSIASLSDLYNSEKHICRRHDLCESRLTSPQQGKKLATPYSKAVMAMLPQTPYRPQLATPPVHEGINDIPVHPATRHQLFVSASESRDFTRADAAKAFSNKLLPADDRIAHPELVELTKWEVEGYDKATRIRMMNERDMGAAEKREEKERKQKAWEARTQVTVHGRRWDFKFQDFSAEKVGKNGRGRGAVGLRYGMPHNDRKRGAYKLPTKVE